MSRTYKSSEKRHPNKRHHKSSLMKEFNELGLYVENSRISRREIDEKRRHKMKEQTKQIIKDSLEDYE